MYAVVDKFKQRNDVNKDTTNDVSPSAAATSSEKKGDHSFVIPLDRPVIPYDDEHRDTCAEDQYSTVNKTDRPVIPDDDEHRDTCAGDLYSTVSKTNAKPRMSVMILEDDL